MIQISVYRIASNLCHATAVHIDYHTWPSRSWVIEDWFVSVTPKMKASEALREVLACLPGAADLEAEMTASYAPDGERRHQPTRQQPGLWEETP